jgi:hypothetical protein
MRSVADRNVVMRRMCTIGVTESVKMGHVRNTPIAQYENRDKAVSTADRLQDRRWRHMGSIPGGGAAVMFTTQFTKALGPTKPVI